MSEIAVGVTCGAGVLGPLVLAVVLGVGALNAAAAPMLLAFVGATVFATHAGASLVRAWRVARISSLALVIAALVCAPVVVRNGATALELVVTIANILLPLHVALQVHRVAAVLARPRRTHVAAAVLLALAGVIAMCVGPREPLALRGFLEMHVGFVVVFVVAAIAIAAWSSRNAIATLAFVVAGAAWVVPLQMGDSINPTQTSGNAFAIAHSVQLVWLAVFIESRAARTRERTFDPLAFVGLALAIGALLLVDVPWLASRVTSIDVVTALLAAQATFAIAHAIIDVVVFRLRAPDVVAALAVDAASAASGRAQVSNARALVFIVPGALIATGLVVDTLQGWLTRPTASDEDLLRAEALHPADARALLPRAVRALAHDDKDEARAALGEIAMARAFSPEAARARLLLCALELDSSHAESPSESSTLSSSCSDVPGYLEDDAEVQALTARLSLAAGDVARAKQRALRAVATAPDEPAGLAALGIVEAHIGEPTAIEHLERALALQQARIGGRDPLTGDAGALDAGVALAQAYDARGDDKRGDRQCALDVATRVLQGATSADRPRHAMRAITVQGHALDGGGDARAALDAYQRGLKIAPFASSPADEAPLWLDVGSLLARSQAPADAVYACALKARALVDALSTNHPQRARLLERATTRVTNLEATLAQETKERVRADVDTHALSALQQAYAPEGAH